MDDAFKWKRVNVAACEQSGPMVELSEIASTISHFLQHCRIWQLSVANMKLGPVQTRGVLIWTERQQVLSVLESRLCARGQFRTQGGLKACGEDCLLNWKNGKHWSSLSIMETDVLSHTNRWNIELSDEVYMAVHFEHSLLWWLCSSYSRKGCSKIILDVSVDIIWIFIIDLSKAMSKMLEISQIKLWLKVFFNHWRKDCQLAESPLSAFACAS